MSTESLKSVVRNISNFPVDGIEFKDITTLFQSGRYRVERILYGTSYCSSS